MSFETSTRFIGFCPVCENDVKVRSNALVHHGYTRPGVGYIIGDCPGVGYKPYELSTEAADAYLKNHVLPLIDRTRRKLESLTRPSGPPRLMFDNFDVETKRLIRDPHTGAVETIELTRAEAEALQSRLRGYDQDRYSWDRQLRRDISNTESELKSLEREKARVERLVADWQPQPLRTIEEEIQHQAQKKAEREAARTTKRSKRIADEVAKIQKRIDSAVRNKNSAVLADIYTSAKLREISGYELSANDARSLLERDDVWRAFGLMSGITYLTPKEADDILDDMTWGKKIPTANPHLRYERGPLPWPAALGGGQAKARRG